MKNKGNLMDLSNTNVYILHGLNSSPKKKWLVWLNNEVEKLGAKAYNLSLPNPSAPTQQEWLESMQSQVKILNENTYFVGHSLGTVAILQFLNTQNIDKIGGYILVSGFYESIKGKDLINEFTKIHINYKKLSDITQKKLVISARDDNVVPTSLSYNLAQNLNSDFFQTAHGRHFRGEQGWDKMPLVLTQLLRFFTDLY